MTTSTNPPALTLKGERCQCPGCGLYFAGLRAFDRHRTGEYGTPKGHPAARRCKSLPEMLGSHMEQTTSGLWRVGRKQHHAVSALPLAAPEPSAGFALAPAIAAVGEPSGATWARSDIPEGLSL
jgi:hypothetical protein